jgi:hypothetical protein
MTPEERCVIEDLFQKLAEIDRRTGLREPEADALIARLAAHQPGAAYYMAQAIVAQERALETAQARIQDLEERARAPQGSGGFLSGIFGMPAGGAPSREVGQREARSLPATGGPWGPSGGTDQPYGRGGGGFLGGAAQTAMGVAGGVVLGGFLADMLTPDAAVAADASGEGFGGEDDAGFAEMQEPVEASDAGGMGDDFGGEL